MTVTLAIVFVTACASVPGGPKSPAHPGTVWQVWTLDRIGASRQEVICVDDCELPSLQLDPARGRARAEVCGERVTGSYSPTDHSLTLSSGWLRVSCPDDSVDREAKTRLRHARSFQIEGASLTLYDARGVWLAEFSLSK